MADIAPPPVELPTNRRSYVLPDINRDIKNPQWIPLLRKTQDPPSPSEQEKELSPFSASSVAPLPTSSPDLSQPRSKPINTHTYTKSSLAPESVELEAVSPPPPVPLPPLPPTPRSARQVHNFELPATRPTSRYYENNHKPTESASTDTETTVDLSRSDSNTGTASTSDDGLSQVAQAAPTVKEEAPSLYPRSTRSSFASTKRYTVAPPTSKFSRKPVPAVPSRIVSLQTQTDPQAYSPPPKPTPGHSRNHTPISSPRLTATEVQPASLTVSRPTTSNLAPALKASSSSTSLASRASHASHASHSSSEDSPVTAIPNSIEDTHRPPSHHVRKSGHSLRSQVDNERDWKEDVVLATPSMPTQKARSPLHKPLDFRIPETKNALVAEQKQAPAPVQTSAEREKPASVPQAPATAPEMPEPARLASSTPSRPGPSSGVSSFMTANDTIIFRRFDEVHVQLLLTLQDEITQLEKDLMKLETASMTRNDRDIERSRIMRELRKVVAEYGKLS